MDNPTFFRLLGLAPAAVVVVVVGLSGCAQGAGGQPGPQHVFSMPIAAGTERIESPAAERWRASPREPIRLTERSRVVEQDDVEGFMFAPPIYFTAGPAGELVLMDGGNYQVKIFEPTGELRTVFGERGPGPGELQYPGSVATSGDHLVVFDAVGARAGLWSLTGDYVRELRWDGPRRIQPFSARGVPNGFVAKYAGAKGEGEREIVLGRFPLDGGEPRQLAVFPAARRPRFTGGGRNLSVNIDTAVPVFTVDRNGTVYFSPGDKYEVFAIDAQGSMKWALWSAFEPTLLAETEIEAALTRLRERAPGASRDDIDWPEFAPAVSELHVDGHGHLYVFHPQSRGHAESPDSRAVDVYSEAGTLLFSGFVSAGWTPGRDGDVYSFGESAEGLIRIIRSELREPF